MTEAATSKASNAVALAADGFPKNVWGSCPPPWFIVMGGQAATSAIKKRFDELRKGSINGRPQSCHFGHK
jgi:hypothetical protein